MSNVQPKYKLKNRHLQMIALGGVIGTGLFFGATKSIHMTGPSIILSYLLGGIVMYIIMRALGEMTVDSPNSGSFSEYANRYVSNYAGFISGWSAWFEYTVVCMVELTAVTVFLDYFIPGIPHWIICLIILFFFTGINLLNVRVFGEFEFWFAGIKILAIIMMLIFSAYLIFFKHSINPNLQEYTSINILFSDGLKGFLFSLVIVVFSFGGSEFVSIAAGEAENPKVNVPKAINNIIIRIILFYILTFLAVLLLYPYEKLSTTISPFVDVFQQTGISYAADIMSLVAITAALSAFNSSIYASSRILYNLSLNGYAQKFLSEVKSDNHVPKRAVLFTSVAILMAVVVNYLYPEKAIMYLLTIATSAILIVWFMILITQIYFRKQQMAKNKSLSYKLIFYPYSNIFAIIMLALVLGVMSKMDDMKFSVYVTPIWIITLSIIYALKKKTVQNEEKSIYSKNNSSNLSKNYE